VPASAMPALTGAATDVTITISLKLNDMKFGQ
jgi:hypothetical protein